VTTLGGSANSSSRPSSRCTRRAEYRVIYRIVDEVLVIEIITISHRRDTYR